MDKGMLLETVYKGPLQPRSIPLRRPRLLLGWLMIAVILLLSLWPSVPMPNLGISWTDKLGHFIAYFVLMGWFALLYRPSAHPVLALRVIALGIVIEILQWFSGYRYFELADIAANTLGVLAATVFCGFWLCRTSLRRAKTMR
jgi:VanZ family protein